MRREFSKGRPYRSKFAGRSPAPDEPCGRGSFDGKFARREPGAFEHAERKPAGHGTARR